MSVDAAFRHEALFYAGDDDFVTGTSAFIRDGLASDEPTLVVVSAKKIGMLRENLGRDAHGVLFADMNNVGLNPARIIPAWRDFVADHGADGRRLRGVGEPIWKGRGAAELVESQRHEALLNVAFAGGQAWYLLCPYDTDSLEPEVVEEAFRSHPFTSHSSNGKAESGQYVGLEVESAPFDAPLPEPLGEPPEFTFQTGPMGGLRRLVARHALDAGLTSAKTCDLVLAVTEVAGNSLKHGGGEGVLRIWQDPLTLYCEVRDRGYITHPLVGREKPPLDTDSGRGLWLVNQLCDLVQVRTNASGTVVRLHMNRA
ncbi:MAG TPA: sensor histidine kinase [Candidatus Dormibacteraeota bacterium]|jgi:anti-sigma regulatory factor (Ser/Thr protein kinase)